MSKKARKEAIKFVGNGGAAFSTGYNFHGQLGHNNVLQEIGKSEGKKDNPHVDTKYAIGNACEIFYPLSQGPPRGIVSIAAGDAHSILLDADGQVWALGSNRYGQLGVGDQENRSSPQMLSLTDISQVTCGSQHSGALSRSGQVYTWGSGSSGRLGLEQNFHNFHNVTKPELVQHLRSINIVQISFCGCFSMALSEDGFMWGWGENSYGQIGLDCNNHAMVTVPTCVLSSSLEGTRIQRIQTGRFHTLAFSVDDRVFSFGRGEYGQLGMKKKVQWMPTEVQFLAKKKIDSIACGANHCLALTSTGKILMWGYISEDQVGEPGPEEFFFNPVSIDLQHVDSPVVKIFAGGHHSACISESGRLYQWGYAFGGRLGIGDNYRMIVPQNPSEDSQINYYYNFHPIKPIPVQGLPDDSVVASVACGGAHTLAVVFNKKDLHNNNNNNNNNNNSTSSNRSSKHK